MIEKRKSKIRMITIKHKDGTQKTFKALVIDFVKLNKRRRGEDEKETQG